MGLCQSYILQCSKNPGAAAEIREIEKTKKYQELANDYHFIPIGLETYGSWGPEGLKLIKTIGKKLKEETGERRSTFYLFQNISIAIQRGNASCVLGTVPHSEGLFKDRPQKMSKSIFLEFSFIIMLSA